MDLRSRNQDIQPATGRWYSCQIAEAVSGLLNARLAFHVIRSGKRYPVARNTGRVIESTRLIRSFRCKHTEALSIGEKPKRFSAFARVAQRKLRQLHAAHQLTDLSVFPGNHLEALKGDREGQYSIRVNDQFRMCFVWREGDAYDVEIVDYH